MIKVGKLNESISFKDIQNAKYAASFMNDRADLTIDGLTYAKIGKNKWEHIPANPHAFGGTYTDEQIYDKVKNSKKCSLNESVDSNDLNESAKISKMTKAMGQGYSGVWQLPSGTPGLIAEAGDMELVVLGDEEGIQIILQDEDDSWFKSYTTDKEKQAVAEFKQIAALMNDLVDTSKLAKKFGLTTM